MSKRSKVLIGCDPELFGKKDGHFLSVHDKLPGTKESPVKVPLGAIQVDGVAAEFNINPASSEEEFFNNVVGVRNFLERMLQLKHPNVTLVATPTAKFDPTYFNDCIPFEAKALGCEPDFNAYTMKANPKPETDLPIRTGSGHIHIGWTENVEDISMTSEHFYNAAKLVKDLDETLFPVSTIWDKDTDRRKLYGQPGSFRPKKYGMEYRVLSNAWLQTADTIKYVYTLSKAVADRFLENQSVAKDLEKLGKPNSMDGLLHSFEILGLPLPPYSVVKI